MNATTVVLASLPDRQRTVSEVYIDGVKWVEVDDGQGNRTVEELDPRPDGRAWVLRGEDLVASSWRFPGHAGSSVADAPMQERFEALGDNPVFLPVIAILRPATGFQARLAAYEPIVAVSLNFQRYWLRKKRSLRRAPGGNDHTRSDDRAWSEWDVYNLQSPLLATNVGITREPVFSRLGRWAINVHQSPYRSGEMGDQGTALDVRSYNSTFAALTGRPAFYF